MSAEEMKAISALNINLRVSLHFVDVTMTVLTCMAQLNDPAEIEPSFAIFA